MTRIESAHTHRSKGARCDSQRERTQPSRVCLRCRYWRHVAKNLPFSRRDPAGADQASDAAAMAQAASFRASGGMGALQMGKELMGLQKGNAPVLTGPGAPKAKEKNSKNSKAQSLLFGSRKP